MTVAPIRIDFAGEVKPSRAGGVLVALLGAVACAIVVLQYGELATEAEIVALQLPETPDAVRNPVRERLDPAAEQSVSAAMAALEVPWSALFNDLETANLDLADSIALLQIEPDLERAQVRIAAEASSLPAALSYVARLQHSETLRLPRLDSHEVQVEQRERPVYFEMTALWEVKR